MEEGLLKKTGKPLKHWVQVVRESQITKHSEIIKYLKSEHDFTHGFANFVSLKARSTDAASQDPTALLNKQYSKGKEHLKPIYELLIRQIKTFGTDIEIVPKNANVSLRRKRQFALIQPSTKTRIDLGLKLNEATIGGRLEGSGSFGSMCSNKIAIKTLDEVDSEVLSYLKQAYTEAG
ncbi:MAG: DUF5655 domain-containing protein [Flavobacteriaceae bacterium]